MRGTRGGSFHYFSLIILPVRYTLLPNDILTPLQPNPNLMNLSSRHINSIPDAESLLFSLAIVHSNVIRRISDRESASSDQVGCCSTVSMRWIMSAAKCDFVDCQPSCLWFEFARHVNRMKLPRVCPGEDMREPPFFHHFLAIGASTYLILFWRHIRSFLKYYRQ